MKYELLIQRKAQKQLANITQPYRDRIIAVVRSLSDDRRGRLGPRNSVAEMPGAFASVITGSYTRSMMMPSWFLSSPSAIVLRFISGELQMHERRAAD